MMSYRKVIAIFPRSDLEEVEKALLAHDVPGATLSRIHGFGEYRNYFTNDLMVNCMRIEIFIDTDKANEIATAITRAVHSDVRGDGIIAVLPVDELWHIREFAGKGQDLE